MSTQHQSANINFINPKELYNPKPNGYSHLGITSSNQWVFIAGQGGEDQNGVLKVGFEVQVKQVFENLNCALRAADCTMNNIVKFTVLIVDHSEEKLALFSNILKSYFPNQLTPTCTLIPVPRLALDGMLIEVEALAVK